MKKRNRNLTEGNISKQLTRLTGPMLFGMLGMVIFNLADTYYVGKLGVSQLAAMSFCFPVIMFVNSLSQGIGIGTSSLISRNIHTETKENIKKMASRAIFLSFIAVLIFVAFGLSSIRTIFSAMGANDEIIGYIVDYMGIWYLGIPFVIMPRIGNNIVRALGDTLTPGLLMISSAFFNIVLDPLLIFGIGPFPEMGIKGAALATVISRSLTMIIILFILIRKEKLLTVHIGRLKEIFATWKKIIHVAAPATLALLITPISTGLITRIIAGFGKEAVAAFGVASRVEMFALMVVVSLGSVLIIFIGQNISKQLYSRIFRALKYALRFSITWGALCFIIFLLLGKEIASFFTDDPLVVDIAKKYLYIVSASYGFQGLVTISTSAFNGINKPYPSAIFSIIRMMVLYIPLAWIGSRIFGINGVFWAALIANILVGVASFTYLHKTIQKIEVKNSEPLLKKTM